MVRPIGILVGLFFAGMLLYSFLSGAVQHLTTDHEPTAEELFHLEPKNVGFISDGPMGKFDRTQLQRGYKVYKEVCSACHSMSLVAFRNLAELGYSEEQVKALAAEWEVPSVDEDTGEATTRPGVPADYFPSPYANEVAARAANNNALPPDFSLIAKAREGGAPYLYSLLTGYRNPPANLPEEARPGTGLYYNPYFANLNIAMAPPLTQEGQVTYDDGTRATVPQMAHDVSAFLVWAAEPTLERRHQAGWAAVMFLIIATILGFLAYKNVWGPVKAQHKKGTAPHDLPHPRDDEVTKRDDPATGELPV